MSIFSRGRIKMEPGTRTRLHLCGRDLPFTYRALFDRNIQGPCKYTFSGELFAHSFKVVGVTICHGNAWSPREVFRKYARDTFIRQILRFLCNESCKAATWFHDHVSRDPMDAAAFFKRAPLDMLVLCPSQVIGGLSGSLDRAALHMADMAPGLAKAFRVVPSEMVCLLTHSPDEAVFILRRGFGWSRSRAACFLDDVLFDSCLDVETMLDQAGYPPSVNTVATGATKPAQPWWAINLSNAESALPVGRGDHG